jgi:hypothetical protein
VVGVAVEAAFTVAELTAPGRQEPRDQRFVDWRILYDDDPDTLGGQLRERAGQRLTKEGRALLPVTRNEAPCRIRYGCNRAFRLRLSVPSLYGSQ